MRKFALMAAVLAVALAGWVRVQLVAVAQDDAATDTAIAAPEAAAVQSPAGPPTKVPREQLTYDGKRFEDYQAILGQEIAPDRRAEAIQALTAFAPSGYAKEVAEIILAEMNSFDKRRLQDARTNTLQGACYVGLAEIEAEVARPLIIQAIKEGGFGAKYLALQAVRDAHAGKEMTAVLVATLQDESLWPANRILALRALERSDRRFEHHWAAVRAAVLSPSSTENMREIAVNSILREPSDTDEFLDRYASEFAVPVALDAIERGDYQGKAIAENVIVFLHREPDVVLERVLSWLSSADRPVSDQQLERVLPEPGQVIPWLVTRFDTADEPQRRAILRLMREQLQQQSWTIPLRSEIDSDDVFTVGMKFLGSVAAGEGATLADDARFHLGALATSLRPRAGKEMVDIELNKVVPDRNEAWLIRIHERLEAEKRVEQKAAQRAQQNRNARRQLQ